MATVTGAYAINFAVLGNANPYTNADFVELEPSTARIEAGVWRCIDNATDARWQLNPATYVPGSTLRAKMELALTGGATDGIGIGLLDTGGNGYRIRVSSSGISLNQLDAWTPDTSNGIDYSVANAQGDTFDIQYVKGTGAITVYKNGAQISGLNLTDTTYAASALAPVLFQNPGDIGQGGIISFAADGVSVGGSSTTVTPTTGALSIDGRAPIINDFTNVRYQEVLINGAGSPMSNLTGRHLVIWYGGAPSGAPDLSYSDMTTGVAGTASYSIATGSLALGQKVFGVITDGGASLSSYTCGLLTLTYS